MYYYFNNMKGNMYLYLVIFIYLVFIIYYIIKQRKICDKIDKFTDFIEHFDPINKDIDLHSLNNFLSVVNNDGIISLFGVDVSGNAVIDGHLSVNNGSEFNGGRHYFQDEENAGRLRIGEVNGTPGIYAEDGKSLVIGSGSGNIKANNNIYTEQYYFKRQLDAFANAMIANMMRF